MDNVDVDVLQHDVEMAARLQASLLPRTCPASCNNHDIWALNRMCSGVGGDFYDFIPINNDQLAIVVGDVVGHGIRAAMIMAQIMGMIRTETDRIGRPAQMFEMLNSQLVDLGNKLNTVITCTMFYIVLDSPSATAYFVNAGHIMPIICGNSDEDFRCVGGSDLVLGVENFEPHQGCHMFVPGERLVLYTDGIVEAKGVGGELFGSARLQETLDRYRGDTPEQCAEGVLDAVDVFRMGRERHDDETIMVIDRI